MENIYNKHLTNTEAEKRGDANNISKASGEKKEGLISKTGCDKYDLIIAACCGGVAGVIDAIFVGAPGSSKLGNAVDESVDGFVKKSAQFFWNNDKRAVGKPTKAPDTLEKCVSYLEQAFPVNYDARYAKDLNIADGVLAGMNPKNHHLLSLAHSPDIIGLVFSIIDQYSSDGSASFFDKGHIIHVVPKKTSGAIPYLQGSNITSKLFCGFINWIGHMLSDMVGSSSTRKPGKDGRGMGLPMPFYNMFLRCDFGNFDGKTLAETMVKVYEEGYDLRHGIATAIPLVIEELMIRAIWVIRQRFFKKMEWKECIPSSKHEDLRFMLIVGNGSFCLVDGVDAAVHGIKDGNWVSFILHLNLFGWSRFTILVLKEAAIRLKLVIADSDDPFMQKVFGRLSEKEIQMITQFVKTAKEYLNLLNVTDTLKKALEEQKHAKEERIRIEAECQANIEQIRRFRHEMSQNVEQYLEAYMVAFGEGLALMDEGIANNDENTFIRGNVMIQKQLDYDVQFENKEEFDELMSDDDEAFKL